MKRTFGLAIAMIAALGPTWLLAGEQEDKAFAKQIANSLKESGEMRDYSVGVKCKDGTVWLAGRVTDQKQLSTALRVVSDIDGVNQIVNNMMVDEAGAAAPSGGTRLRQVGSPAPLAAANSPSPGGMAQQTNYAGRAPAQLAAPQAQPMRQGNRGVPRAYAPAGQVGRAMQAGHRAMPASMAMQGDGGMPGGGVPGNPMPAYVPGAGGSPAPAVYDEPNVPNYAWPSYAAAPNYAAVSYPKQYSASAWPFIGPFYPYPQVPLGWRKVSLEWDDGWWFLDFDDQGCH